MRRLLSLIFALAMCASSAFAVTVAGNLQTLGGSSVTTSTFVRFTLKNATGTIPIVSGSGSIVKPTQDFYPDPSGDISGTIYGNDKLTPGTTYYQVCIFNIQPSYPCANYEIAGTGTFNLDSATPLLDSAIPVPQSQTILGFTFVQTSSATTWTITHNLNSRSVVTQCFDPSWTLLTPSSIVNTDLNTTTVTFGSAQTGQCVSQTSGPLVISDASAALALAPTNNQTVTGSFSTTFDGPLNVNGALTASSGGALTGTFTGSPTLSGSPVFSGNPAFTGAPTVVGNGTGGAIGLTTIADQVFNANAYASVSAAITAAETAGGGVVLLPPGYAATFTAPIVVGDGTHQVTLQWSPGANLTCNINNAADYCFQLDNGGHLKGYGIDGSTITVAATANVAGVIAPVHFDGSQEYFSAQGLIINVSSSATIANAVINMPTGFVPSYLRDITAYGFANTIGLWIHATSTSGVNVLTINNVWMNGSDNTGARPCVISADSSITNSLQDVNWYGGACEHAGPNKYTLEVNGNGNGQKVIGVGFYGVQVEPNASTTVSPIFVKDAQAVNFFGGTLKSAGSLYSAEIAQTTAGYTDGIGFWNIRGLGGSGCVTNDINSHTDTCADGSGTYYYSKYNVSNATSSVPMFDSGLWLGGQQSWYGSTNNSLTFQNVDPTGSCNTGALWINYTGAAGHVFWV
ncbi:MAG: hypothetical protein KGI66_01245, partial [Patescibacteria group bacterium]|nr:hypothetical protein [Patescibacteria group bacterium]